MPSFKIMPWLIIFTIIFFSFKCKPSEKKTYIITPSIAKFSISKNTFYEKIFYVKNIGSEKLLISEVATACGCMVGTLKDSTVFPKDSVAMKVTFTPNSSDTGEIVRFITIRTNGTPPIESIELRGNVH